MAKRARGNDGELNMDSLMDAVTNVVGVLMIVFVMMALNLANSVAKILSELPPVTPEEHQKMKEQLEQTPPPPETPEQIEEKMKLAQQESKKATEDLRTIDVADLQKVQFMDLETFRKRLDEARVKREDEKKEVDKLLTEVERLKALLDETPEYKPEPATVVRLPNPRPYPAEPKETRVLVAKGGVIFFNEGEFMAPIMDGLSKMSSQLTYKEIKIDPFAKVLTDVLGSAQAAQQSWNDIAPLASTFQMEDVAVAWKELTAAGLPAGKEVLFGLGDIALTIRQSIGAVGGAVASLSKGDPLKWAALDPSRDPANPTIKAVMKGQVVALSYGNKTDEVKVTPRDVMGYFKDLSGRDGIKNRSRSVTIYDAFKIQDALKRAAGNQAFTKAFGFEPEIRPGQTLVFLKLTPTSGGGESLEQMKRAESNYQRQLRQIAADPNGVAVFQVMPDAFATYLEARIIADQNNVSATWETLASLELSLPVRGYDVQRFAKAPVRRASGDAVTIKGPKRSLD
jgi:flagellar motor protein MotB